MTGVMPAVLYDATVLQAGDQAAIFGPGAVAPLMYFIAVCRQDKQQQQSPAKPVSPQSNGYDNA